MKILRYTVPHGDIYGEEMVEEIDEEITLEEVHTNVAVKEQESTRRMPGNWRNDQGRR